MARGAYDKVYTGQALKVHADVYNGLLDLLQAEGGTSKLSTPVAAAALADPRFVLVKNLSETEIARFAPVGLESPIFDPPGDDAVARDRWVANLAIGGRAADPAEHGDMWGIARAKIPPGKLGLVQHQGLVPVRLDRGDPLGSFADIKAGLSLPITSPSPGKPIVWIEPDPDDELLERWAVIDLGLSRKLALRVVLGEGQLIPGETARWRYPWAEAVIDGDPTSPTYLQYVPRAGGLSSAGSGGTQDPARMAINRLEAHHIRDAIAGNGFEGKLGVGPVCELPGVLPNCPPARTLAPRLRPIPAGVTVIAESERTTRGDAVWVFDAQPCIEIADPADGDRKFNLLATGAPA